MEIMRGRGRKNRSAAVTEPPQKAINNFDAKVRKLAKLLRNGCLGVGVSSVYGANSAHAVAVLCARGGGTARAGKLYENSPTAGVAKLFN